MREDRAAHRGDEVADHFLGFDHAECVPGAEVDADGGQLHLRDVRQLVRGLARNAQSQASLLGPAPPEAVGELKTRILEVHVPSLYRQKGGYGTTYPPWRPLRVPRRPDALAPADRGLSARGGGDRIRPALGRRNPRYSSARSRSRPSRGRPCWPRQSRSNSPMP